MLSFPTIAISLIFLCLSLGNGIIEAAAAAYECPPVDGNCVLQSQYDTCIALVDSGCTNIRMAKSCPVQFSCTSSPPPPNVTQCPEVDGVCFLQEQYDDCIKLVNAGCQEILMLESCPVQVACATPIDLCPPIDGSCVLQEQYDECQRLVNAGCTDITIAESCPVQIGCNAPAGQEQCPPIDGECIFQEQYDQCKELEESGCTEIFMQKSCPPKYFCQSYTDNETTTSFFTQWMTRTMRAIGTMLQQIFSRLFG
jgi:hypothetical protein